MAAAEEAFRAALERCPGHSGAETGLGYVSLRDGNTTVADEAFRIALAANPENTDALIGLGLIAWRMDDLREVALRFGEVRELDPDNATAAEYLARVPEGYGPAPERPSLVLPDTVVYPSRVEFPDSAVYAGWIAEMAEMGANTIRVYTIHPPDFYRAVEA